MGWGVGGGIAWWEEGRECGRRDWGVGGGIGWSEVGRECERWRWGWEMGRVAFIALSAQQ